MLVTFSLMVWGLSGDSPYRPEFDEALSVTTALNMVKTGDPNPHWLAHPGSTLIYPLAGYYHILNATVFHGSIANPNLNVQKFEYDNVFLLFYIPRYLNVFLLVASVPLMYGICRRAFDKSTALFAIWIFAISPLMVQWCQLLRSDASALFYTLVAIFACFKIYEKPSRAAYALFGVSLGLAVSSRWPSLAVLQVFAFINGFLLYQKRADKDARKSVIAMAASSLALSFVVFAVTSPYVFIAPDVLKHDLIEENAAHGLGCDGLNPLQNFTWYMTVGIPERLFQPQWALALIGAGIAVWRRQFLAITLATYTTCVLAGTSLHVFHAVKWLVPIMPMLTMFTGSTLAICGDFLHRKLAQFLKPKLAMACYALIVSVCMLNIERTPFLALCAQNTSRSVLSTDTQFYEWVNQHIPHGTRICFVGVWEGAHRDNFEVTDVLWDPSYFDAVCGGKYKSPFDFYDEGFRYFVWTDNHAPLYMAEPDKYPRECKFFKELFDNSELVYELKPRELSVPDLFAIMQRGFTWRLYKFVPKVPRLPN